MILSKAAASDLIGSFRRLGSHGPAYEVIRLDLPATAEVVLIESGDELRLRVDDVRLDPDISASSVAPIFD